MNGPRVVPCAAQARVTVTGPITHLCPHVDEVDEGEVTLGWTTDGATIELHSLAAHLATYKNRRMSHEDLIRALTIALTESGIHSVTVTARFTTAGLAVEVSNA